MRPPGGGDPGHRGERPHRLRARARGQGLHPLPRPPQPGARDEEPPDEHLRGPDLPRGAGQRPEARERQHRRRHRHGDDAPLRVRGGEVLQRDLRPAPRTRGGAPKRRHPHPRHGFPDPDDDLIILKS